MIIWGLKSILGIALFAYLFSSVEWSNLGTIISSANYSYLILAILLAFPNLFFSWFKWDYVVRFINRKIRKRDTLKSLLAGMSLDTVVVSPIGDYGGRMVTLGDLPKSSLVVLQFFEKIQLYVISIFVGSISIISVILTKPLSGIELPILITTAILFSGISIFGLVFILQPSVFQRMIGKLKWITRKFHDQMTTASKLISMSDAFFLFFLNCMKYVTFNVQFYLLILAFTPLDFFSGWIAATATLMVRSVLSGLTIGDLGIRELSSVYFFSKFAVVADFAFYAAFLLFLINRFVPSIFGFGVLFMSDLSSNFSSTKEFSFIPTKRQILRRKVLARQIRRFDSEPL